jgi:hypothetical protein
MKVFNGTTSPFRIQRNGGDVSIGELATSNLTVSGNVTVDGTTDGINLSNITATPAELNLLDLVGLTTGWVLSADSANTASWKAPTGGGGVTSFNSRTGSVVSASGDYDAFYNTKAQDTAALALKLNLTGGALTGNLSSTGTMTGSNFILSSDATLKENVKQYEPKTINVDWKSFDWKNKVSGEDNQLGVIAQELEANHPEFVTTDKDGIKGVKYIELLIAKLVELESEIKKLKN